MHSSETPILSYIIITAKIRCQCWKPQAAVILAKQIFVVVTKFYLGSSHTFWYNTQPIR